MFNLTGYKKNRRATRCDEEFEERINMTYTKLKQLKEAEECYKRWNTGTTKKTEEKHSENDREKNKKTTPKRNFESRILNLMSENAILQSK